MNFQECTTEKMDKLIVVEENGRKFTIQNENRISIKQVRVDGCLINDNRKRCDYLFEIEKKLLVIYLELKGKNIDEAYEQLVSTVEICLTKHKNLKKECYIIASRVPKITTKTQNLQIKIQKTYNAVLKSPFTREGKISI